jgi:hypothetical protein
MTDGFILNQLLPALSEGRVNRMIRDQWHDSAKEPSLFQYDPVVDPAGHILYIT